MNNYKLLKVLRVVSRHNETQFAQAYDTMIEARVGSRTVKSGVECTKPLRLPHVS